MIQHAPFAVQHMIHAAPVAGLDDVSDAAGTLHRFVEGLCRLAEATAAALVRDNPADMGGLHVAARVACIAAAEAPLDVLVSDAIGRGQLCRHGAAVVTPEYRGLWIDASSPGVAGRMLLLFAAGWDGQAAAARALANAAGFAATIAAMRETAEALASTADQQQALAAPLNQSECGVIVIRADRGMVFSNAMARAILAERDGIELRRDLLRPTRYQDAVRFQTALDDVLARPMRTGGPTRHSMMLLLERSGGQRPLIAVITPIPVAQDAAAAAIVYVMRPEVDGSHGIETICQLHGLSPVESQLVARLTAGTTLIEAAAEMRIKPDTARAYLKQVFAKTDTHRQTDLIQLMNRYQRAVRGDFVIHAG